jgi:hypothetical protein
MAGDAVESHSQSHDSRANMDPKKKDVAGNDARWRSLVTPTEKLDEAPAELT